LQSAKKLATKKASNETKQWCEKLKQQSKEFTTEEVIQASNKYRHISCPAHSSATKHNTYHANKINFKDHRYIAAQGPYLQNIDTVSYFIAMLAENESPVSISFVQDSEFGITKNTKLPPQKIGKTINIPAKIINGITIRKAITITMLNSIKNNANNLQVDILSINGKKHVRLYDLAWEDFTGGDLERLTAISLFTEYISSLPELKDRKNKPKVINCNAGIGRTGTAILIDHMSKEIESGKTLHENQLETDILHVRNSRPWLVEQKVQLETLRMFIKQGHKIIANIKARFNI
jgi:protein tyrosine phosphatase